MRGDPFFHRKIGKFIGQAAKSVLPAPVQMALSVAQNRGRAPQGPRVVAAPGLPARIQRLVPGGATGLMVEGKRKRRRINPANSKALNRATRRIESFVGLAKRALKHTGWKVVSKGSGRGKKDLGRGHSHVR